ncbi:hypothetical protein QJQ45_028108 [Haematococcus lacustris]|nr:hypothetical protein QJQ45_028108 [Haematococcus lacustris]
MCHARALAALVWLWAAGAAHAEDTSVQGVDKGLIGASLLFVKLRPSQKRTKTQLPPLSIDVVDRDTAVISTPSTSMVCKWVQPEHDKDLLATQLSSRVTDFLLQQQEVYEVQTAGTKDIHRRKGDPPLQELKSRLARAAREQKQKRNVAYIKSLAKRQGIQLPSRKRAIKRLHDGKAELPHSPHAAARKSHRQQPQSQGPARSRQPGHSKRTEAERAAEPTQLNKGKGKAQGKAQGKAARAKPAPQPGRWLDRDCNAALNMQRIGESRWRPLELCYWPKQGALPAKGKEYPGPGYKRLRDKPRSSSSLMGHRLYSRVETQPGLDAFAHDPLGLESRSLQPLLAWARAVVPPRLASCTPLFLLATAGMRKQSPAEQHAIMGKVREVLQYSGFRFEAQWARVMEGAEEGAADWVSLNYQHNLLQPLLGQVVVHPTATAGQASGQDGAGRAAVSAPAAAGLAHQQPSHVGMRRQHADLQQWEGQEQQAESVRRLDEHPGSTPGSGRSARPDQVATSPPVVTADRDRPAASAVGLQQPGGSGETHDQAAAAAAADTGLGRDIANGPTDAPMAMASSWAGNADGVGVEVGKGRSASSDTTHGILDLGGSSLEVTFYGTQPDTSVPQSPIALGPALHTHTTTSKVLVGWSHLHLTSHTLTGFGLTDTFDRGVAQLLLAGQAWLRLGVARPQGLRAFRAFRAPKGASRASSGLKQQLAVSGGALAKAAAASSWGRQEAAASIAASTSQQQQQQQRHQKVETGAAKKLLNQTGDSSQPQPMMTLHHPCLQSGYQGVYTRKASLGVAPAVQQLLLVGSAQDAACQHLARGLARWATPCLPRPPSPSPSPSPSSHPVQQQGHPGDGIREALGGTAATSAAPQPAAIQEAGGVAAGVAGVREGYGSGRRERGRTVQAVAAAGWPACQPVGPLPGLKGEFIALSGFWIVLHFLTLLPGPQPLPALQPSTAGRANATHASHDATTPLAAPAALIASPTHPASAPSPPSAPARGLSEAAHLQLPWQLTYKPAGHSGAAAASHQLPHEATGLQAGEVGALAGASEEDRGGKHPLAVASPVSSALASTGQHVALSTAAAAAAAAAGAGGASSDPEAGPPSHAQPTDPHTLSPAAALATVSTTGPKVPGAYDLGPGLPQPRLHPAARQQEQGGRWWASLWAAACPARAWVALHTALVPQWLSAPWSAPAGPQGSGARQAVPGASLPAPAALSQAQARPLCTPPPTGSTTAAVQLGAVAAADMTRGSVAAGGAGPRGLKAQEAQGSPGAGHEPNRGTAAADGADATTGGLTHTATWPAPAAAPAAAGAGVTAPGVAAAETGAAAAAAAATPVHANGVGWVDGGQALAASHPHAVAAAQRLCSMPWAEVERQLGHHANVERYCLWAHYVIALLGPQGLGLQPGQVLLGPGDAGWPLGALIQALSSHLPHLLHPGLARPGTGAEPTCADLSPGSSLPVPAAEPEPGQLVLRVEACSKRALLASLLLGLMVRGWFTHVNVLADGQEAFEEIPPEAAVIPNLGERNMFLQLICGLPPPGENSRHSAAVEAVLAAYPCLHARLNAVPRYEQDSNTVDNGKEVIWLQGQGQGQGAMRYEVAKQRRLLGLGQGVVVDKAWLEREVNRVSLLRHAVDTSRQLEEAHVSWQLDYMVRQAGGGQRNTRPYRLPSPLALTPGCSCKAHNIKLDTRAIYDLMRTAGMLPADVTSEDKFRSGVVRRGRKLKSGLKDSETFAQVVHTDGVAASVMFTRPKPAEPPGELPRMGKELGAFNPLAGLGGDWLGCDSWKTNMATVAHEERYPFGVVKSVWHRSLTSAQYYRQGGITQHAKESKAWLADSLQRYRYAATVLANWPDMWAELSKPVVRRQAAHGGRPLALTYESAGFSGSGTIGSRGVPVKQMQREACRQFPGRVVLVHEFRVSPARTNVVQGQAESFRGIPMFDEMRDTLLAFEATINYNAPAQERAFYNALRTLLSDLLPAAAVGQHANQLTAAYKWPRAQTTDPGLSAALAASLSIPSLPGTAPHTLAPPPPGRPASLQGPGSERKFGAQHEFFNAFTHEPSPTRPSPAAATSKAAGGTQGSQAPGPPASTAAKASKGNLAGGRAARPPLGLAVVHQPALGSSTSRGLSGKATERLVVKEGEAAGGAGEEEGPGPLMALGSVLAPRATARVGFDPDKVDDTAGAKPTTQGQAPSWYQGPFRTDSQAGRGPARGAAKPSASYKDPQPQSEAAEVEALRQKWSGIERVAASCSAQVHSQVQAWAVQRGRLEEEIVRRQEASRYAAPSLRHLAGPAADTDPGQSAGYVSAYAGVTCDAVQALAAGFHSLEHAGAALRTVPGLAPGPTLTSTAREVRCDSVIEYDQHCQRLASRMQQLGLASTMSPEALQAALAPVPDKSYLECVAKLPRPGEHLASRPPSRRTAHKAASSKMHR